MGKAADRRSKDQAMSARLKKEGAERATCRCALCHNVVSLTTYPTHVMQCGTRKDGAK